VLLSTIARTSFVMSSFPNDSPFVGLIPYHLASRLCKAQAQQHTQAALYERFPILTEEHWDRIFAERRPLLWVDEAAKTVEVAENALPRFITYAAIYEASLQSIPTQQEFEGQYLARQLTYYCELARKLVAVDPMLTHPDSIADMRTVFQRLSVGNYTAECLSEPFEKPMV
jgi:hypothetical protein